MQVITILKDSRPLIFFQAPDNPTMARSVAQFLSENLRPGLTIRSFIDGEWLQLQSIDDKAEVAVDEHRTG